MRMQLANFGRLSVQLYPAACGVEFPVSTLSSLVVFSVPLLVKLPSTARYVFSYTLCLVTCQTLTLV